MVFDDITAEVLITTLLGLPPEYFTVCDAKVKHKDYTKLYQLGTIRIFSNEPPNATGCYLVLGGKGIDELFNNRDDEENKGQGLVGFLRTCKIKEPRIGSFHLTRLDIAIDDKNDKPYFTVSQIQKKCLRREFVSTCKTFRFNESSFMDETAKTVYIGDGKSNISFRIYEKDKEQASKYGLTYDEEYSWNRTEIQLRDEYAQDFAMKMINGEFNNIGEFAFNLLSTYLRFVDSDQTQSNKSRWRTSRFWVRFLGAVKPLKLERPEQNNSLKETENWLAFGGAISAIKAFLFLKEYDALGDLKSFEELLAYSSYSPALCSKIVAHLNEIGKSYLIPLVYKNTKGIDNLPP